MAALLRFLFLKVVVVAMAMLRIFLVLTFVGVPQPKPMYFHQIVLKKMAAISHLLCKWARRAYQKALISVLSLVLEVWNEKTSWKSCSANQSDLTFDPWSCRIIMLKGSCISLIFGSRASEYEIMACESYI